MFPPGSSVIQRGQVSTSAGIGCRMRQGVTLGLAEIHQAFTDRRA